MRTRGQLVLAVLLLIGCGGAQGRESNASSRTRTSVRILRAGEAASPAPGKPSVDPSLPEPGITHTHGRPRAHITPAPPVEQASLDDWTRRYPDAARELAEWMKKYPATAQRLFELDSVRADAIHVLTEWAVTARYETIRTFLFSRAGWDHLRHSLDLGHEEGLNAFLTWTRRSAAAAEELATHPRGMEAIARKDFGVEVREAQNR
jgi:hypothetical protein